LKKFTALLLLSLLVYHTFGYYLYFALRQWEEKRVLQKELSQVPDNQLLLIKVPIPLYHQTDRDDFETTEGEVAYQGKFYEKVKQKVYHDTLYVYCLDNVQKARLMADLSEHTRSQLDLPGNEKPGTAKLFKSFIKEYLPLYIFDWQKNTSLFYTSVSLPEINPDTCEVYLALLSPPPRKA
jgi:hypothetical protein